MTQWYYSKMGLQQGPVPEDELRTKIRRGEIGGANLVWREGMAEWMPLSQVPELTGEVDTMVAGHPKPEISPPPREAGGSVPLAQPPAYHGNYLAPRIPTYMWQSVVATVIGMPFCCFVAFPFGIVAIIFSSKVEALRVQGDLAEATTASNNAKTWMIISFVFSALGLGFQLFNYLSKFSH